MTDDIELYAHSIPGDPDRTRWEPLRTHLAEVGELARSFAAAFCAGAWAKAAGLLHDIGKAAAAYQVYIGGVGGRGPDHSTAGAREAVAAYGKQAGRLIAFAIAGHHAGLADGAGIGGGSLDHRLDAAGYPIEDYSRWRTHVDGLPDVAALRGTSLTLDPEHPGFTQAFFTRMIFSCLVDADRLATERFYALARGEEAPSRGGTLTPEHLALVRAATSRPQAPSQVNARRAEILAHALGKAPLAPGLFTLTVPTGGGKTLTSLRFAMEHAAIHRLRRVIYVIPFTSIIEQTAEVFRDQVGLKDAVLEHHSSFDWDKPPPDDDREHEGRDGLAKLHRDTENWDAPVIVTTAVQFWESLFANRPGKARKLHNLANSVIVLDEAQTLPTHLLRPCMAAARELCTNYGASVILCTATQPALRRIDDALPQATEGKHRGQPQGFDIGEDRELAPDPRALYAALKRVRIEWAPAPVPDADIAARFAERPQMLCIVNSRAHARTLFELIKDQEGACHLTTLMCARHRRAVLATAKAGLKAGHPARIVSTSLIEAGVDISLPEVWRASAGLDAIAQAAGRVNRNGELGPLGEAFGRTLVFEPADAKVPRAIASFYEATRAVQRRNLDPLSEEGVRAYFQELYFLRGYKALDEARLEGDVYRIMEEIESRRTKLSFPFASIARAFRLIDDVMEPVLIPYDDEAEAALTTLRHVDRPPGKVLRTLQQYTVSVPQSVRRALLQAGAVAAVNERAFGDRFVRLTRESRDLYDPKVGLTWADPTFRTAESLVFA